MKLHVFAEVRYWEDAIVNGKEDTENGDFIPCKNDGRWAPIIDVLTGRIENWEIGTSANIHYKVCDRCGLYLKDDEGLVTEIIDGYVPKILYPKEDGFGDYIIMDIDENGFINKWNPQLIKQIC